MVNMENYDDLIRQAQQGHPESLNQLTEFIRAPLETYVYRSTLQAELAQDITQESLLEMIKILGKLDKTDRFWSWLCGIAFNKIRNHRRREKQRTAISLTKIEDRHGTLKKQKENQEGLAHLMGQELQEIVLTSMQKLKPAYRDVLSMRCYEEMEYADIARIMDCSEFSVRMLFFRAKKSLAKQLSRHGLGKGSLLLVLVLFGKLTAPSQAAAAKISVTAATLTVGTTASVTGTVLSGTGAAVAALTLAGMLTVASPGLRSGPESAGTQPDQNLTEIVNHPLKASSPRMTAEGDWYYFPAGSEGPVMMRQTDKDSGDHWLQNHKANYFFDACAQKVYLQNGRRYHPDLTVFRLPTDPLEFRAFLAGIDGGNSDKEYVQRQGPNMLILANPEGTENRYQIRGDIPYGVLEEEFFQYHWPAEATWVDLRDQMHKSGWTYFRLEGEMKGQRITGEGRIPFVYATSEEHWPWLRIQVGNQIKIVDSSQKAWLQEDGGTVRATYPAGHFWVGLARPWLGLHTMDLIRRDAAQQDLRFETLCMPNQETAQVIVIQSAVKMVFTVDMVKDVVERITYDIKDSSGWKTVGEITFFYLQELDPTEEAWIEPPTHRHGRSGAGEVDLGWLLRVVEGTFRK